MASQGDEKRHPNGVIKAETIDRTDSGLLATSGYIAAIDFGTTNCSIGYCTAKDEILTLINLDNQDGQVRVPTILLVDEDGKPKSFGKQAIHEYEGLVSQQVKCHLFERIKLALGPNEVRLNCTMVVIIAKLPKKIIINVLNLGIHIYIYNIYIYIYINNI